VARSERHEEEAHLGRVIRRAVLGFGVLFPTALYAESERRRQNCDLGTRWCPAGGFFRAFSGIGMRKANMSFGSFEIAQHSKLIL
jgi:hypothetical protein